MARANRGVIAINVETGERKEFEKVKDCMQFLGTDHPNVLQALNRNGVCCGWKLSDTADTLRERIRVLVRQLKEIEGK